MTIYLAQLEFLVNFAQRRHHPGPFASTLKFNIVMRCDVRFVISWLGMGMLLLAAACANMGHPSGGPRDEDPPRFVSANPGMGATEVDRTHITLTFNELVNVKDAFSKVVVSPTSKSTPRVASSGRRVTIDFDSLAPNTTYTVDFADAIEDNNEGNKLQGFAYSFSTGPTLDTLRIAGRVLSARALEPQQGILVGVHANLNDTAFTGERLLRVARTDDRGRFNIRGLAPGSYRVFALKDNDNDYRYSSPEEDMAFYDVTVSPSAMPGMATDTIYNNLTGEVDSVVTRNRTIFLPNDIVLRSFNSELRQQYMTKYERIDSTRIFLKFNTLNNRLPEVRILGSDFSGIPGVLEKSQKLDSLVYWLTPELVRTDTLQLEVKYGRSDQNLELSEVTDTLSFITARPKVTKKEKKEKKVKVSAADSIAAITTAFSVPGGSSQDVYLPVKFETPVPLRSFDRNAVHLSEKVDSLYKPVTAPFTLSEPDSLNPRVYQLDYPWEFGKTYKLEIDSLAGVDLYGKPTRPFEHSINVKKTEDYCSVLFALKGLNGYPAFVELLNGSDAIVRTVRVKNDEAYFPFLTPGRYFARVILDDNENGVYDTGDYHELRQPELAYYYPKAVNIKKMWDQRVDWDVFATPLDEMKPQAVLKNKPATDTRNRNKQTQTEEEEEEEFDPTRNPFDPNDRGSHRR